MSVTLAAIRTRVRQRSDQENSEFVTDTELNGLINTEYNELWALLAKYNLQRSESVNTITATGASSYVLPTDFYSLIGVFRTDGQVRTRLTRFTERVRPGTITGVANHYRLVGSTIVFYPTPTGGTYEAVYIPKPTALAADIDTLDGVLGWEELIVISVAIKVMEKEEADTSNLRADKAAMIARIQDEANMVEFTENWVVDDTRRSRIRGDYGDLLEGTYLGRVGVKSWPW